MLTSKKFPKVETPKPGPPIKAVCPRCKEETHWYWTRDEMFTMPAGSLACGGCGWVEDPVKLGIKPFSAWLKDKTNYAVVNKGEKAKEGD
jgi:hypothetical protein